MKSLQRWKSSAFLRLVDTFARWLRYRCPDRRLWIHGAWLCQLAILHAIGVPAPHLMAWATILVEIFGGLAILIGAFVVLASIPMAAILLVAMFTVHLSYGFSSIKLQAVTAAGAQFGPPGYETDLLYLASLATLAIGSSGPLSIDGLIRRKFCGASERGRLI